MLGIPFVCSNKFRVKNQNCSGTCKDAEKHVIFPYTMDNKHIYEQIGTPKQYILTSISSSNQCCPITDISLRNDLTDPAVVAELDFN